MLTVNELLKLEETYYGSCQSIKGIDHRKHPISFHFRCIEKLKRDKNTIIQQLQLTDSELLAIMLHVGSGYSLVNECLFTNSCNELQNAIHGCLDSALLKLPKCEKSILYRQDKYYNIAEIEGKETIIFPSFFTTSLEDFETATNIKWIIIPLGKEKTKARNIYEIYDPGVLYFERQVTFERNANFEINKIEKSNQCDTPHIIHISEI